MLVELSRVAEFGCTIQDWSGYKRFPELMASLAPDIQRLLLLHTRDSHHREDMDT